MGLGYKAKEKIKKILKRLLNNFISINSQFSARAIVDNQVFCQWKLTNHQQKKLFSNTDHYLSIRIFDITNSDYSSNQSCIMKELKVNKEAEECFLMIPVADGSLLLELGYRKPYGEWFVLASTSVRLCSRDISSTYPDDSWFYFPQESDKKGKESIHEKVYQLANPGFNGGSETVNKKSSI